jgi:hypothetical protein
MLSLTLKKVTITDFLNIAKVPYGISIIVLYLNSWEERWRASLDVQFEMYIIVFQRSKAIMVLFSLLPP